MIKYQTNLSEAPSIFAPHRITEEQTITIQDESKGIIVYKIDSINNDNLELSELSTVVVDNGICTLTKRQKEAIQSNLYYHGEKLIKVLSEKIGINSIDLEEIGAGSNDNDVFIYYDIEDLHGIQKFLPDDINIDNIENADVSLSGNFLSNSLIEFKVLIYVSFNEPEEAGNTGRDIELPSLNFTYKL